MMSAVSFAHQQHEPLTVTGAEGPSSPTALARLLDRLSALEGRLVGVQVLPMPAQTGSSVGVAELEEHLERLEMALDERDFCALQRQLGVNEIASRKQPALFAPQPLTLTDFGALFVQSSAVFLLDNMSAGDFARVEAMFAEHVGERRSFGASVPLKTFYILDPLVSDRLIAEAEKEPDIVVGSPCVAEARRKVTRPAVLVFNQAANRLLVESVNTEVPDLWSSLDRCTKRLWARSERQARSRRTSIGSLAGIPEEGEPETPSPEEDGNTRGPGPMTA